MLAPGSVILCLEVGYIWWFLLAHSVPRILVTDKSLTWFLSLLLPLWISLCGVRVLHSRAKELPGFILWTPLANLLAFVHQPDDTVLVVLRPASAGATAFPHRRNAQSPCQLDVTHAVPQAHQCDNPVIINMNLSVSAQGAKVLWSREVGGEEKADTLSTGGGTVIFNSGFRQKNVNVTAAHRTVRQEKG